MLFPAPLFQEIYGLWGLWLRGLAPESKVVFAFNCHTQNAWHLEATKGFSFDFFQLTLHCTGTQMLILSVIGKHQAQFQDVILWGGLYIYIAN